MKKNILIGLCFVIMLGVTQTPIHAVVSLTKHPPENPFFDLSNPAFAAIISLLLFAIITFALLKIIKRIFPETPQSEYLQVIFTGLAVVSFIGYMATVGSPPINPVQGLLAYWLLPGLILSFLGMTRKDIVLREQQSRISFWSRVMAIIIFGAFIFMLPITGGTPFLCVNNNICSMDLQNGSCDKIVGIGICVAHDINISPPSLNNLSPGVVP